MADIIWTEAALNNLNDIAEYIALSNPSAAKQLVRSIFSCIERLRQQPKSGRMPPELLSFNYREVVAKPCRIFYKIEQQSVVILFVMRQEQDLKKFLIDHKQG